MVYNETYSANCTDLTEQPPLITGVLKSKPVYKILQLRFTVSIATKRTQVKRNNKQRNEILT